MPCSVESILLFLYFLYSWVLAFVDTNTLSTLLYLFTLSFIYVHTCRTFYKNFSKRADVQILSLPPDQQATLDKQGIFEIVYRKSSPKPYPRGLISFNQLKGGLLERGFIENLWYVRETIYWGLGVLAS